MAQVRDRPQIIPDIKDNSASKKMNEYENWSIPEEKDQWDRFEEEEEEMEEEEFFKEPSYEIYEPPPPEEREIGQIIKDSFGFYKRMDSLLERFDEANTMSEDVVYRYTLCNANGMLVQVITLGATITAIRLPDNKNVITDVSLGLNSLEDYASDKNQLCFGAVMGRFNSFIYNGNIKLGKEEYFLSTNVKGIHHDKGGFYGFDKALWQSYVSYDRVIMTHVSPHMEEGYPGDLMVQISFHLTKDNALIVNTTANTSQPTILSIGHNLYFNLAGHETGPDGLKDHSILVNADKYIKVDSTNIPTGDMESVGATYFDLRVPRPIWKAITRLPRGGYDHVFCLTKGYPRDSICFACRLVHPPSGRYLEIMTDMPGLYINTGTSLPNTEALPPLEAQLGFDEEVYPEFCREEKIKEKLAKEFQSKMAEKQSWPRQEVLPETSEIELPIPHTPSQDKNVSFRGKSKRYVKDQEQEESIPKVNESLSKVMSKNEDRIGSSTKLSRGTTDVQQIEKEGKNDNPEENESINQESPHIDEIEALKFLKDVAESDEEEFAVPKWLPPQPIIGRKGAKYKMNGGICLMTQEYPDSMRHKEFPKPVIKPGQKYSRTTIYKFGIIPRRSDQDSTVYL